MGIIGALARLNNIDSFPTAFAGAKDITTDRMREAISDWFGLYFDRGNDGEEDPCQRLPYTIVSKLTRACFSEYEIAAAGNNKPFLEGVLAEIEKMRKRAMQLALIGGEAWLKPVPNGQGFDFVAVRRDAVVILGRGPGGEVTSIGSAEASQYAGKYYTLLERRTNDGSNLIIESKLFCSDSKYSLGSPVQLGSIPQYEALQPVLKLPGVKGIGMASLRVPIENDVDGSMDAVSVYSAAAGLIHNINKNEQQLNREFENGESRVIASEDLLKRSSRPGGERKTLPPGLFVGVDDDPDNVGITIFSPQLREQSFLARKTEYLRNVENLIGIKRGILSEVEEAQRTATEITSSQGDYSLTIGDLQQMWEAGVKDALLICCQLGKQYRLISSDAFDPETDVSFGWGNGVLYDADKEWAATMQMVQSGMLKPEIALAWKYDMPWETEADLAKVRKRYMPEMESLLEDGADDNDPSTGAASN